MKTLSLFALCLMLVTSVFAAEKIEVKNAFVRLPPPGSMTAVLFMDLINHDQTDRTLEKITGSISDDIELHEMASANGQMMMRNVKNIALKKGAVTTLKSGGLHVMLFQIKKPLKENESLDFTLILDRGEKIPAKAIVKKEI